MNCELKKPWGALFDLDGVLVDSEGAYTEFWHDIDARYPTGVERFEYVIKGNTLGNILDKYFPDETVRNEVLELLLEQEENMVYRLFDGVVELLNILHAEGVNTAIVTSSNNRKMGHLFTQIPMLEELIDVIITEQDVTRSKPDPQGYNLAAERLGLDPCRCVVFEDSLAGVEAGRRAGGAVVGIATTNPPEKLEQWADIVVASIADVEFAKLEGLLD